MKKVLASLCALFFIACQAPIYTDGYASQKKQGDALSLGLDKEDFEKTAEQMVQSMLNDPDLINIIGERRVLAVGRILNDTSQRIDTDQLISRITIALRRSGKFILTTAVAAGGARDQMSEAVRQLRANEEFNQNTIANKGTLIAPDFSISGKIRQDNIKLRNGNIQAQYFFHLVITDLNSGLAYWEDERTINKVGSSKSVTW